MSRTSLRVLSVASLALLACTAPAERTPPAAGPQLSYGPVLRSVDARSARILFRAAPGGEASWTARVEIGPSSDLEPSSLLPVPSVEVTAATDFVAHVTVEGLKPQTRYHYVPLVNGSRVRSDAAPASFVTPPDLGGRNADFTTVFLADQHQADEPEPLDLPAYAVASRERPLFWAQLGDVAAGTLDPQEAEERRSRATILRLWSRNFGDPASSQARFARSHSLNLATISDHELMDNFCLNWHRWPFGNGAQATLFDRLALYDRSIGPWWNHFGWGMPTTDRLGRVALEDHGESVMAEPVVALLDDVSGAEVCVAGSAADRFAAADFVFLADDAGEPFHTRVSSVGTRGDCAAGKGTTVRLEQAPPRGYERAAGARLAVGARYARHGHYHTYAPFPFVEFFLLDTSSYRGDVYQEREFDREANRDTDHSRYPWDAEEGKLFIFGDRAHGANRTTDGVRSWLGPTQRDAFLEALSGSTAEVIVVAAGYPLYSAKFERSQRKWEGRESGLDFATELGQIVSALERLDRLVLWVHGDGHTPMLVRLRENLYQLQVGPTVVRHTQAPGHRPRSIRSGERSPGDSLGGGTLIAGHQPDLSMGDGVGDVFRGHLDQFEGLLRLYFHPGRDVLRNAERVGLSRGESDHVVEIPAAEDPAGREAASLIVGKVVRVEIGGERFHSTVASYEFADGRVRLELDDPIVTADPDLLRVIVDGNAWVEAAWIDSRGREWRDFSAVLRKASEP